MVSIVPLWPKDNDTSLTANAARSFWISLCMVAAFRAADPNLNPCSTAGSRADEHPELVADFTQTRTSDTRQPLVSKQGWVTVRAGFRWNLPAANHGVAPRSMLIIYPSQACREICAGDVPPVV